MVCHGSSVYMLPKQAAETVTLTVQRPRDVAPQHFVFTIGNRRVCKDIFCHRYPVSRSTFARICAAKLCDATSVYDLRPACESEQDSTRGIRGQICAAWWQKYAEHNSERLPDVKIRLLPCLSFQVCVRLRTSEIDAIGFYSFRSRVSRLQLLADLMSRESSSFVADCKLALNWRSSLRCQGIAQCCVCVYDRPCIWNTRRTSYLIHMHQNMWRLTHSGGHFIRTLI